MALRRGARAAGGRGPGDFSTWVILIAGLANIVWSYRSWPWYGLAALFGAIVITSILVVTVRTLSAWLAVRHLIAIATSASAGLLWAAYRPG